MKREMLKNTIRWVVAGLLCALLFSGLNASAETVASGECAEGNIAWTLDGTGLLTISGTGDMENYTASNENRAPWYTWKDQIITVTIGDGITSIGDAAFYYSSNLTSITIPNGVESIGDYAIYLCSRLTEVIIPDTVTSIGSNAFYSSNNIASINIPDGLASVGNNAFSGYTTCYADPRYTGARTISKAGYYFREQGANYSLKYLFKSSGEEDGLEINKVDQTAETFAIPDEVTYIGQKAFYNCGSLTSVTIPSGVTGIGNQAFSYCSRLRSITVPDGLTSLGYNTFTSCNATLPTSILS